MWDIPQLLLLRCSYLDALRGRPDRAVAGAIAGMQTASGQLLSLLDVLRVVEMTSLGYFHILPGRPERATCASRDRLLSLPDNNCFSLNPI